MQIPSAIIYKNLYIEVNGFMHIYNRSAIIFIYASYIFKFFYNQIKANK